MKNEKTNRSPGKNGGDTQIKRYKSQCRTQQMAKQLSQRIITLPIEFKYNEVGKIQGKDCKSLLVEMNLNGAQMTSIQELEGKVSKMEENGSEN